MGTWGEGLFSDDTALDVRGSWEDLYKRFGEPVQTTRELLKLWNLEDPDEGPVVVLALAMCQWKYGCLQADTKARALEVVRSGAGLEVWEGSSLAKRKAVYGRIASKLEQPQPPLKRIKTLTPPEPEMYKPGDLLSYRCSDGEFVLLWVQGFYQYKGDRLPCCAALDWKGPELPTPERIRELRPIVTETHKFSHQFMTDYAREHGLELPPAPPGLTWSRFAPRGLNKYAFDPRRIEVVPGEWHWDLSERKDGPYVPYWIELGCSVMRSLSATIEFQRTLRRETDLQDRKLPTQPRTLGPIRGARPLGVHVELPTGKVTQRSRLLTLKRSRHAPAAGDIFVVNVMGKRWVAGRVIVPDGGFAWGTADVLVYFYKQEFQSTAEIMVPMALDLLIPPAGASWRDWSAGDFFHVANFPLQAEELPPRHVFGPGLNGYYRDVWGRSTSAPAADELVGSISHRDFGYMLAETLGLSES